MTSEGMVNINEDLDQGAQLHTSEWTVQTEVRERGLLLFSLRSEGAKDSRVSTCRCGGAVVASNDDWR